MKCLHIKKIDKYHPGYKDRELKWCKIYFAILTGDPEFELLEEIDKWRFVAFIILELQLKRPIPLNEEYLRRKGFDLKKRPIFKTLQMLQKFTEINDGVLQDFTASISISKSVTSPSTSSLSTSIKEIIDDLNLVLGTKYRYDSKRTNELIKGLLEKFTIEDFKIVHRKKLKEWGAKSDMIQYLRPITLYSNKFESYLNQKETTNELTENGLKAYLIGQSWLAEQKELKK